MTLRDRLLAWRAANPRTWAKNISDTQLRADLLAHPDFSDLPLQQKAAAVILGYKPVCECGEPVKFINKTTGSPHATPFGRWSEFCSASCARSSTTTVARRTETMIERFGTDSWVKTDTGRARAAAPWSADKKERYNAAVQQTSLEKYGVAHFTQSEEWSAAVAAANLKASGGKYTNPFQDTNRIAAANLAKYGVKSWRQTASGREHARNNNAMKRPEVVRAAVLGRRINTGFSTELIKILTADDATAFAEFIHKTADENGFTHRRDIAQKIGVSYQYLNWLFRQYGMRDEYVSIGSGSSFAEIELRDYIKSLGVEFITSDRKILHGREIDILIPDKKIGIEFNGVYYHSERAGNKDKSYHLSKTIDAEAAGYQLLHICESDWSNSVKREIIKSLIAHKCGITARKIAARKCVVSVIDAATARQFLDGNHLSGFVPATQHLGLYFNTELVAVLSYGASRFKHSEIEIHRFAVLRNCAVSGGFGKLFKHVPKENLVSYADRRISGEASIYNKFFKTRTTTPPSWWGFQPGTTALQHRMNFTKKKLSELPGFNPDLTADENLFNLGFDRIWDCGNWKFSNPV